MSNVGMRDMLEAGVHFGHQVHRWNPKMRPFLWGQKNGIHIINLQKTVTCFRAAIDFMSQVAKNGDKVLYIGTKRQAQEIIEQEAGRRERLFLFWSRAAAESPWVDFEWRHLLRSRGPGCIDTVLLEPPRQAPLPPELADLSVTMLRRRLPPEEA